MSPVMTPDDPRYDMPEPEKPGAEMKFLVQIEREVLANPTSRLYAEQINHAAQTERQDRLIRLARQSKYSAAGYPLPDVHRQINLLMDEKEVTDAMIAAGTGLTNKNHEVMS